MSIDFKDIFRLENCVHKKGFLFGEAFCVGAFPFFRSFVKVFLLSSAAIQAGGRASEREFVVYVSFYFQGLRNLFQ